jgi:hypothetical protein
LAPALNLEDAVIKIRGDLAKEASFRSQGMRLFCDTLSFKAGAAIDFGEAKGIILDIYARLVDFTPEANTPALKIKLKDAAEVKLHIPGLPQGMVIEITSEQVGGDITKPYTVNLGGKYGVRFKHTLNGFTPTLLDAPLASLKHTSYMDLLDERGNVRDSRLLNE